MIKRKLKKGILFFLAATIVFGISQETFASTNEMPISLEVIPAMIDVTVTPKIAMNANGENEIMDVTDIEIVNNASNRIFVYSGVYSQDTSNGWNLTSDETDFTSMNKDQKKYSLVANGQDLAKNQELIISQRILPNEQYNIVTMGKTGISTVDLNDKFVGNFILNIGINKTN